MATTGVAPRDKELEDLASAVLSCLGYYVSSSLVNRPYGQSELSETDVLAIRPVPPAAGGSQSVLVEAKSGVSWGNKDLFKVLGQKVFIGADHALLLTSHCDPGRAHQADVLFARHGLRVVHIPSSHSGAHHWTLWSQLAELGLAASPDPPPTALLAVAVRAAHLRRAAYADLRRSARNPGHSTSLPGATRLLNSLDDVNLHLANPGARAGALWASRADWHRLPYDLAEEAVQGPGHAGRTPEGEEALAVAKRHPEREPLLRAALQLVTDVQLELALAAVELALNPAPPPAGLPSRIKYSVRQLRRAEVSSNLPQVLQHVAWHLGGTVNRWELKAIAAELGTTAANACEQVEAVGALFGSDWTTKLRTRSALTRRNKARELDLLSQPVIVLGSVPGHSRANRWRATKPTEAELSTID